MVLPYEINNSFHLFHNSFHPSSFPQSSNNMSKHELNNFESKDFEKWWIKRLIAFHMFEALFL